MARKSNVAARRAAVRRDQEAFYATRERRSLKRVSNTKSMSFPKSEGAPLIGPGAKRAFRPKQGSGRYR